MEYLDYFKQIKTKYLDKEIQDTIRLHNDYVKNIIDNGKTVYPSLRTFFEMNPVMTSIPELKLCIDYLKYGLDIDFINQKCHENSVLDQLRQSLYCSIFAVTSDKENSYLYGSTIRVIMKIIDFYDIIIRSVKQVPPYYHKYRYERYVDYCISQASNGLFMFPTFANIGATDLLKLRCYPMFPIGLSLTMTFVDEYEQSPVEFFIHDINHIRRMFESNILDMNQKNIDISNFDDTVSYYNASYLCLKEIFTIINNNTNKKTQLTEGYEYINIPKIEMDKSQTEIRIVHLKRDDYSNVINDEPIDLGYSQLIKIIVFEITHEDSLPMHKDVICKAILRNSGIETIFPRIDQYGKVIKMVQLGGSILGFVKYKLRYGFFDNINSPIEQIVKIYYRTDKQILIATQILLKKLCREIINIGSNDYYRIIINITDKNGLNKPEHEDHLEKFPQITNDPIYGDYTEDQVDYIRQSKGILQPNLFTGERPKSIVEQGNLLTKLGGKTTKNKKKSRHIRTIKNK
jgi:hypothetical protein